MECPSCEENLNLPALRPRQRLFNCPHCKKSLRFYMQPRDRVTWICMAVFFLTTAALFAFEGFVFLFAGAENRVSVDSMLPLFFLFTGIVFFAGGALFLVFFESRKGFYVEESDTRIGFANALSQLPQGLVAVFLGGLLALPVFFIWGPNKHWALSIAAGCSGEETPASRYNDLCQNLARAAFVAGAETGHGFPLDGLPPLANALAAENLPMVYLLLDQGADVNQGRVGGVSPMFDVIDDYDLFKLFVEKGGRVDITDHGGRTLLWYAAARGDLPVVRELMLMGNPVNRGDQSGVTPLMVAVKGRNLGVIRELIRQKANVRARNGKGATALMMAAQSGYLKEAEVLLAHGANVHARLVSPSRTDSGMSALDMAVTGGHVEMVRLLLRNGAPVNADAPGHTSPLIQAVATGQTEIAELLLGRGADVNHPDSGGWTALHWAAQSPDAGLVMMRLLLRYRADVHARGAAPNESNDPNALHWNESRKATSRHWTPLHLAARAGNRDAVLELLGAGADPNALTGDHRSPLSIAAHPGGLESVLLLLNRGAQTNFPGQLQSPLHNAAKSGALDVARALVGGGASLSAKNGQGHTPWDVAMSSVPGPEQSVWTDLLTKPKNI